MSKIRSLLLCLPALLLVGCSTDDFGDGQPDTATGQNGEIVFDICFAPGTRVSTAADFTSVFEDGDEIGIFAVAQGTSLSAIASANYINNVKLTYNKTGGTWTQATALYWPTVADNISALDFYAYYPYDAGATNPKAIAFNVKIDQSDVTGGKSHYNLSDLLTARTPNSVPKGTTVTLTFSHALSMVQLTIDDRVDALDMDEDITVTLRGFKPAASLDLGGTFGPVVTTPTTDNSTSDIKMYRVEQSGDANYTTNFTFRALVPAQIVASGQSIFRIANGNLLLGGSTLTTQLTLTAGIPEAFTQKTPFMMPERQRLITWVDGTAKKNWTNSNFTLAADVDLSDYSWTPVGTSGMPFTGTFDGSDYTITGLSVNVTTNYAGMFGYVGSSGAVRNVTLSGTSVNGRGNLGGIAGYNTGIVSGCSLSGTVTGTDRMGGIVGYNSGGTIVGCTFSGTVSGTTYDIGGITGYNISKGVIACCSVGADAIVSGANTAGSVGGIVGYNETSNQVVACWSAAKSVTGNNTVGGITGRNWGSTTHCYWLWNTINGIEDGTGSSTPINSFSFTALGSGTYPNVTHMNAGLVANASEIAKAWEWALPNGVTDGDAYPIIKAK